MTLQPSGVQRETPPPSEARRPASYTEDEWSEANDTELQDFDIHRDLPEHGAILAILDGKRGSGKTVWMENYLWETREKYDYVFLFSGSHYQDSKKYFPMIAKKNRFKETQFEDLMDTIWRTQVSDMEANKGKLDKVLHILIVGDDLIGGDSNIRNADAQARIATTGRHINISFFILTQSLIETSKPVSRENSSLLVVFRTGSLKLKSDLVDAHMHFGKLHGLKAKRKAYKVLENAWGEPHQALVIAGHLLPKARRMQDFIFKSLAETKYPKKFKLHAAQRMSDVSTQRPFSLN